ncbi:MAG: YybH family protein [Salibacteraceae bacterium]
MLRYLTIFRFRKFCFNAHPMFGLALLFLTLSLPACQEPPEISVKDREAIRTVLREQQEAWNRADLEGYMAGYWPSDSLRFIGKRGLTYGWETTLANYQKSYPDARAMGKLSFDVLALESCGAQAAYMIGKWHLERADGDLEGHFTLLWRKLEKGWCVVADHSS